MEKNETFQIQYNDEVFDIPKSNVKFEYGYAIVEKTIKCTGNVANGGWYGYELPIKSVVDEDFEVLLDCQSNYSEIQIFPEGNIMVTVKPTDEGVNYVQYHYQVNGKMLDKIDEFNCWNYERINETTIKLKENLIPNIYEVLYDVVKKQFISEKFTKIKNFEFKSGKLEERFAEVTLMLPYNDGTNNTCELMGYIDEQGKIRTNLYSTYSDTYIDTKKEDFDFTKEVETIKNEIENDALLKKSSTINRL